MTVTISNELEVQVRNKAKAEGVSVESYVESLIREDEEWREQSEEPLDASDPEFAQVQGTTDYRRSERHQNGELRSS